MTADRRSMFQIAFPRVRNLSKLRMRTEHTSSKPHSILLHQVLCHCDIYRGISSTHLIEGGQPVVHNSLYLLLKSLIESIEQGTSSRQHNVIIKPGSILNWALLDSIIHNLTKRLPPILMNEFLYKTSSD